MNDENLIPFSKRSPEEQRRIRSMGGKACAELRKERKSFRELLELGLEVESTNKTTGEVKSVKELSMLALAARCKNGDLKAIKLAAELLGEYKKSVNLETSGTGVNVIVRDGKVADDLQKVINIENGDE